MHSLQHATKPFASVDVAMTLFPTYHVCSNLFWCISIQVKLESDHFMVMSFQLALYHLIASVTHLQQAKTQSIHCLLLHFLMREKMWSLLKYILDTHIEHAELWPAYLLLPRTSAHGPAVVFADFRFAFTSMCPLITITHLLP